MDQPNLSWLTNEEAARLTEHIDEPEQLEGEEVADANLDPTPEEADA